jgi:hypothetical protein
MPLFTSRSLSSALSWSLRSALLLSALLPGLASCTEPVERTQVTVLIDADESVRDAIRYVDVEVRSGSANADVWPVDFTDRLIPSMTTKRWPLQFSLRGPDKTGRIGYRITATAKDADDKTLLVVRARSDFVEGKSLVLRLRFDEACMKRTELCPDTFSCHQGECIDPFVPASELPTTSATGPDRPPSVSQAAADSGVEPQAGSGAPQAAGATAATGGCGGSACAPAMCAARDDHGVCLPCPAGFLGADAKSCSPGLISLAASSGTLSPAFDPQTTEYTLEVPLLSERVTWMLEAPSTAEVHINGRSLEGKLEWTTPALQFGDTEVLIALSASGSKSRTYTVTLKRNGMQLPQVTSPFPSAGDAFGTSLAISGDLMLVGAPYEDGSESKPAGDPDEAAKDSGAAYLFERTAAGWMYRAYLKAETPRAGAHFAFNLAIDGTRFAIGVPSDPDGGSVYTYDYAGGEVRQVDILHGDTPTAGGLFGRSVALQGNRLVIGLPGDNTGANEAGSLYVYEYESGSWQRSAILRSKTPGPLDWLGSSVAFDGDLVVSGATGRTVPGEQLPSGATYVFERTKDGWGQAQMLWPTTPETGAFFGEAVSVLGSTIAVGGFFGTAGLSGGSAYVFMRGSDGQWTQQQVIRPNNSRAGDWFGDRVVLTGDLLVVGASHESSATPGIGADGEGTLNQSGAVYVFSRSSGTWSQSIEIKLSEPMAMQELGLGLAVSNGTLVAGVPSDPDRNGSSMKPGGVYVFR